MSRIQVVKPNASSYASYYGHGRRNEPMNEKETTVIEKASTDTNDVLGELKESRKLNEMMRNELQQVIRFNVALQNEIDALKQGESLTLFQSIIPRDDVVQFEPIVLKKEIPYFIDVRLTYVNIDIVNDAGVIVGLYTNENSLLIGSGSASWYGRTNENFVGGMQTIVVTGLFTPLETKEYTFFVRDMDRKHAQLLLNHPDFPCIMRIDEVSTKL